MMTIDTPRLPNQPKRCGFIALLGRPNVGKSSLLNRFVGQKVAITSSVVQTTRHRMKGIANVGSAQLIFLDSPGLSKPLDTLGQWLVDEAKAALADADTVALVVDGTLDPGPGEAWLAEQLHASGKPMALIVNKIDRLKQNPDLIRQRIQAYENLVKPTNTDQRWLGSVGVSAKTGLKADKALGLLVSGLPYGAWHYDEDTVTDQRLRELAAEFIREQVMRQLYDELPHSVAVVIDSYTEPTSPKQPIRVVASLLVDQTSQKGMVIGKGGHQLKAIRLAAQTAFAKLAGNTVAMELHVSVRKNWRKDPSFLKQLGLATDTLGLKS
jgi:GTP-binding protein Era